ncbi:MAG: carboxypeptidase-like regulatory domain-containing protein, partial [Bacteroidales bacterium]|nr:carboxypeptidase-like regulatory domain-containing protein [Bacteroidales bacterium]
MRYKTVNNQYILYNQKEENLYTKSNSQKDNLIKGIIIDSVSKEPLPYATVIIENKPGNESIDNTGLVANDSGYFEIKRPSSDSYRIKVM